MLAMVMAVTLAGSGAATALWRYAGSPVAVGDAGPASAGPEAPPSEPAEREAERPSRGAAAGAGVPGGGGAARADRPRPSPAATGPARTAEEPEPERDGGPAPVPGGDVVASGGCEASYYWEEQPTASGEVFDPEGMTAAHKTLAFDTRVRVTNPASGSSVVVRINDRGPYVDGRCLDLARGAFRKISSLDAGVITVTYEVLSD